MKNNFSNKVKFLMENNKAPKLNIIFEKDSEKDDFVKNDPLDKPEESQDEETKSDQESNTPENSPSSDDLFNIDSSETDSPNPPSNSNDDSDTDKKDDTIDKAKMSQNQLDNFLVDFSSMKNSVEKALQDHGLEKIQKHISNAVRISSSVRENVDYKNKSITNFIFEDSGISIKDVEKDIETLDAVLTKGTDLVDKFKKGKEIDIQSYVSAAINAYENFDNLFAKEEIIKQASINVLVLNSGAKAETHIKDFEELFHKELEKQFGVEYEEHALVTKKFNVGAGAKSQG